MFTLAYNLTQPVSDNDSTKSPDEGRISGEAKSPESLRSGLEGVTSEKGKNIWIHRDG